MIHRGKKSQKQRREEHMDLSKEKPFSGVLATNQKLWNHFQKEKANVVAKMNEYDISIKEFAIQIDQLEKTKQLYSKNSHHYRDVFSPLNLSDNSMENEYIDKQVKQLGEEKEKTLEMREDATKLLREINKNLQMLEISMNELKVYCFEKSRQQEEFFDAFEQEDFIFIEEEDQLPAVIVDRNAMIREKMNHKMIEKKEIVENSVDNENKSENSVDFSEIHAHNSNILMLWEYDKVRLQNYLSDELIQEMDQCLQEIDKIKWMMFSDMERAKITLDRVEKILKKWQGNFKNQSVERQVQTEFNEPAKIYFERYLKQKKEVYSDWDFRFEVNQKNFQQTIPPIIVLLVLRIMDELFENIKKHSESDKISIYLNFNEKDITLQMSDNGIGISEDYLEKSNWHSGLHFVEEWIYLLNGTIEISGDLTSGTIIDILIPV